MTNKESRKNYWKDNIRLVCFCLSIWFITSLGFAVLLVDILNNISFFGFKLGFWFAQQGSVISFNIIIFFYANRMAKLDKKYNLEE